MNLDLRAVSAGMALATLGGLLLLPAASAAAITEASQGSISAITQPAMGPSTEALITSWARSFAADSPNSVTNYPADLLPTPGASPTITDIAPGHLACVGFTLNLTWPAETVPGSTAQISAAVADAASVAFSRNATGVLTGEYFVGSSTCQAPIAIR